MGFTRPKLDFVDWVGSSRLDLRVDSNPWTPLLNYLDVINIKVFFQCKVTVQWIKNDVFKKKVKDKIVK